MLLSALVIHDILIVVGFFDMEQARTVATAIDSVNCEKCEEVETLSTQPNH